MPTRTLNFSTFSDTLAPGSGPAWGPGNSTPPFPSGYTLAADPPRITTGKLTKYSGSANTVILDDTALTGNIIAVEAVLGTVGSDSQFLVLCDPLGNGYQFLVNSTNIRCFSMTNFVLGAQVGSPIAFVATTGHTCRVERNNTSGAMVVSTQGVTRGTINQANVNTNWRAGVGTRNAANISSFSSIYTASQSVDSINGGSPIVNGQTAVPFTSTGFNANTITAITTNRSGVTASGIVNSGGGAGTFNISDMIDGGAYPSLPTTVTYTFSDGTNTATIDEDLNLEPGWEQVTYANASPINDRVFCWHLDQSGISIADGTIVIWQALAGFAFTANGDSESDSERTVLAKVRDESTGLISFWTVTINDAGVVAANRGITTQKMTSRGIVMRPLTMRGM